MVKRGSEENISPEVDSDEPEEFDERALDGLTSMEEE
jgi:hypothetical protein